VRVLLTGSTGFVGTWLRSHLVDEGDHVVEFSAALQDGDAVRDSVRRAAPEVIYHLAGQADVAASWRDPEETFTVNALGTLRVLEAARALSPVPRVLVVSSAEVYGKVTPAELPLREQQPARPASPYGVSKLAAEELAFQSFRGWDVPVIVTRAFNHIGPGQSDRFVVPAMARQIAEAERSGVTVIETGNLTPRRDYTDVRDVVRAYRLLASGGQPGELYNVCTGRDLSVEELVDGLRSRSPHPLEVRIAPERVRPVDVPVLRGDPAKLVAATGWSPRWSLDQTLDDVLADWRARVANPVV
jgi:GDP-4-dehydro-6-deoxy-D-mannose reductase